MKFQDSLIGCFLTLIKQKMLQSAVEKQTSFCFGSELEPLFNVAGKNELCLFKYVS